MNQTLGQKQSRSFFDVALFLLFISLPFERLLTWDVAGFTVKLPYIMGGILLVAAALKLCQNREKIIFSLPDYFLFSFVAWSYLTAIWSIDQTKTLIVSSMFLFMALIYLAIKNFADSGQIKNYIKIFIYLGVATAVFSYWQFFADGFGLASRFTGVGPAYTHALFGFPRVQSTFFEPGFFANFLLIPLFLSIYLYIEEKKSYSLRSLLIIGLAFFLTLSRGAFVAFVLSAIILLALIIWSKNFEKIKNLSKPVLTIISSFVLAILCVFIVAGNSGVKNYFSQIKNSGDVVQYDEKWGEELMVRGYTINVAMTHWREHRLLGIGTGAFGALPEFTEVTAKGNARQTVNSLYPEIMVEEGLVGLFLFLAFLLTALGKLLMVKKENYLNFFFATITLAIFIQYASFSTLYLVYIWVFLGIVQSNRSKT
ncbi:MAG: O-antigen ligase family protein [Candidatus Berkelbacteria bacterium]